MAKETSIEEMAAEIERQKEQELEQKERALRSGKLQRYVCKDDCFWNASRYRPGDIQDFNGNPPENFPKHHFERIA